jgi:1-aminocyclopropane-1-carboxylate deaminase/D-cysteine desulfhydrase-like pyridoxal-dependent ACC family enzyme
MSNIMTNSPTQQITFQNHHFCIKRDDLLDNQFSGNKARKLAYYLENDFYGIDTLVSYGSAQSNAMYSMSVLAQLKGWRFIYYVDHIASFLKNNPNGNYACALDNNMEIIEGKIDQNLLDKTNILYIPEGGAIDKASFGLEQLAKEIREWKNKQGFKETKIFLPSGTGTTAVFLQKFLEDEVLTCPCVGDSSYLKKQFMELVHDEKQHPTILQPFKKFHFGKLYKENYEIWNHLKNETKIEFDLLYDPIGWQVLLDNIDKYKGFPILYIHQGGLIGNVTMIERYHNFFSKKNLTLPS